MNDQTALESAPLDTERSGKEATDLVSVREMNGSGLGIARTRSGQSREVR